MLDIGTGTGILAVTSILLGAQSAVAVDYNQVSLTNAQEDIRINGVEDRVQLVYGMAVDHLQRPADLLIGNLYYDVIIHLMEKPELSKYPRIIFSGLLSEFVDRFPRRGAIGLGVIESRSDYSWYTFLLAPKG